MSPKQMGADLNLAWPTAEIAVMGPEAAVNIIYKRDLAAATGSGGAAQAQLVAEYTARFANPYVAAERGYIDDVIEPSQTRRELMRALQLVPAQDGRATAPQARQHPALSAPHRLAADASAWRRRSAFLQNSSTVVISSA